MATSNTVLFVSHEATRTGAPIMLLHLLRWLREESDVEPEVALLRGGPLEAAFLDVAPVHILGDQVRWPGRPLHEAALSKLGQEGAANRLRRLRLAREVRPLLEAPVVYLNSAVSLRLLHFLAPGQRVICHVHELEMGLRSALTPEDAALLRTRVDVVVAAADCVADNLIRNWGVSSTRITRVYEFVTADDLVAPSMRTTADLRAELGVPGDAPIVGGAGSTDWRKGVDLFVQVARRLVHTHRSTAHFVWVGGENEGPDHWPVAFDVAQAGLEDRTHFVGLQDRPYDWYRLFDVLTLTSREDPYPLVGLETSLLEVPMVCFERAGGMTELIDREAAEGEVGVAVPYLDVEAMAAEVAALLENPTRRKAAGRRARAVVRRDHDVAVAAPELLKVVERVAGAPGR